MSEELDDREALAAEYVLGCLPLDDCARVEVLIASDPEFAHLVATWQRHLMPLAAYPTPVEPPAGMWQRIEAAIEADPRVRDRIPSTATRTPEQPAMRWRRRLWLWRTWAIGASAAAAALVALTLSERPPQLEPPPAATTAVAVLTGTAGEPAWIAVYDRSRQRFVVEPTAAPPPMEKVRELWLIAEGKAPRSLGLLDPKVQPISLAAPPLAATEAIVLAVSLEPPGGSPTGSPTGPVILHGAVRPLPQ